MLIDANGLPVGRRVKAAVCVVGTGMGGTATAKRLVEAGLDVLFVEAGNDRQSRHAAPPVRYQVVGPDLDLPLTRIPEIGGRTNAWQGICAPLDPIDFERRDWIAGSGWPTSHLDLERPYAEASAWLGVGAGPPGTEGPLPVAPGAEPILAARHFWASRRPARMKEVVLRWTGERRARCLMNAVALELRADETGRVRSLLAGCGGGMIEIEAEVFVVAAGGLETPRLLLNSGHRPGRGLGEGAAWTGRGLMDHPVAYFSQARLRRTEGAPPGGPASLVGRLGHLIGFALRPELQREFRLGNHYVFVRPGIGPGRVPHGLLRGFSGVRGMLDLSLQQAMAILGGRYTLRRALRERFGTVVSTRHGEVCAMAEQVPDPGGSRVELSASRVDSFGYPIARVDRRFARSEWREFDAYLSLVARGLRQDARVAAVRLDDTTDWPRVLPSAAHHLGTARMAAGPEGGVVDAELRVFGCRNLFVCDGSVVPTSSGIDPTLTICALGLRLGERLTRELRPLAISGGAPARLTSEVASEAP